MSETDDGLVEGKNVEILHRINHLKRKAGGNPNDDKAGRIDEDAIKDADRQVEKFCNDCPKIVKGSLEGLVNAWEELKQSNDESVRSALAEDIFTKAHQIKDVSSMCGYVLISDFGESLRDYILETKLDKDAHEQIVQAHIDVMMIAYKEQIKDDGGPVASELRSVLRTAMKKYS